MAYSPDAQQLLQVEQKQPASPVQPQRAQARQTSYIQPEFRRTAESQRQIEVSNRTGCLTIWTVFGMLVTGIMLVFALTGGNASDPINAIPVLSICISAATFIGYVGVLCLKKWGYCLVLSLYLLVTLARMGIVANSPIPIDNPGKLVIAAGMIGGLIFFVLGRNAVQYMD